MTVHNNTLRKIYLHGAFAQKFGKEPFEFAVNNSVQLWRALCFRFPDFEDFALEHREMQVIVGYGEEDYHPIGLEFVQADYANAKDIHVMPKVQGSGIEAALLAAGYSAFAAAAIAIVANIAISMVVSAVIASLAPKPKASDNNPQSKASRLYTGAALYTETGGKKAMIAGECMVNFTSISQGIGTQDIGLLD